MTTAVTDEPDSWTTPAGWGIYADLTPPELLNGRKLHHIQRLLLIGVVLAALIVVGAFGYSMRLSQQAAADLAEQNARNAQITTAQARYSAVTGVQATAAQFRNQLHSLMTTDVEFSRLLAGIRAAQPKTVATNALEVMVNSAGAVAAAGTTTSSGSLATSGVTPIGTITIGGTVDQLRSLQLYIAGLQAIPGVVDVLPGTLTSSGGAYTFTLAMSIDARALTNRYVAVGATGAGVTP